MVTTMSYFELQRGEVAAHGRPVASRIFRMSSSQILGLHSALSLPSLKGRVEMVLFLRMLRPITQE